ncbi:MAG: tRNA lysidine(34) synthetase TilS [Clostridiales bacterium]|nr:tRNA lysidine(34) synthetase TilS [Clostridiales bacterium]
MKLVTEFADKYDMLPRGSAIICAVSGGADSVCLLHIIKALAARRELSVYAAHFNHCLRGEESDRDERFVREICRDMGVELFVSSGDVKGYAERNGLGTEEAARMLRYEFFDTVAAKLPGSRVATAHNADDNAETVLMNLARGAGLKGLCGIPPVRDIYIRPLLCMSRDDIIAYLNANSLPHVEDSTNAENTYTRNRLRHDVLPVLKSINPNFSAAALEASELLRTDESLLESLSENAVPIELDEQGRVTLNAAALTAAEYPLAARAVRSAAGRLGCAPGHVHVQAVLELAKSADPSAQTRLPGNVHVSREYDSLVFSSSDNAAKEFTEAFLRWDEWTVLPEAGVKIYFGPNSKGKIAHDENFFFKKSDLCGNISVRPRRAGDRICLNRRQGGKTLKKLFIEKKIPASRRGSIPVIADEKKVLAVISLGQSCEYAAKKEADCVIAVKKL